MGLDVMCKVSKLLNDIAGFANMVISDTLVVEVEGLVALAITLQGCADHTSMATAILLYVRKFMDKSLTATVTQYIRDIFEYESQSDFEYIEKDRDWLQLMRDTRDNWELVRNNRLFSHFSKLLGLVVTLGMCKVSDVTFTVKDYKLWEPDMKVVHGSAMDIADAALQTVAFFVENFSLCYAEQSLKPLLQNDRAATELDTEYSLIISWWGLVKNGNLKKVAGASDNEFDRRLEALCTKLRNLLGTTTSFEKKLIQDKFTRLLEIKNEFVTSKISSGVRQAPFVICLFGGSSQGKTTCGDQILDALLTSAGLSTDKANRCTYNASDKFMSNWTTSKEVLIIDDFANDRSEFVERPPTRVLVDMCNNQPFYVNKADLGSKGNIFAEPKIVLMSTNVKALNAKQYSNCPYSIQRRVHVHITVEAKPQFQIIVDGMPQGIDPNKVAEHYQQTGVQPVFDDIWDLTIEAAVQPPRLDIEATYAPLFYKGKPLVKVPFSIAIQFMIEEFHKHELAQEHIIDRMRSRSQGALVKCPHNGCRQLKGYCDLHDHLPVPTENENQWGELITKSAKNSWNIVTDRISNDIFGFGGKLETYTTLALLTSAKYFARRWDWINLIPTPWLRNEKFRNMIAFFDNGRIRRNYALCMTAYCVGAGAMIYGTRDSKPELKCVLYGYTALIGVTAQKSIVQMVRKRYDRELLRRNTIAPAIQQLRDRHVGTLCKTAGIVGTLYALSKIYKCWRGMRSQGSLEPKTISDVQERDAETNVWTETCVRTLPTADKVGATREQMSAIVSKNLVYGTICVNDKSYMVNGLFIKSNIVVIPNHCFYCDTLDVTFRKENPDKCGGKFAVILSKSHSYHVPNTDLRICYASSGGSFKDISCYFPEEVFPDHEFDLIWRGRDGKIVHGSGLAKQQITANQDCSFNGYGYKSLSIDTFKGMCGAPVMSRQVRLITGLHLGGVTGTPRGCCGILLRGQIDDAISKVKSFEGVIVSGSAGKFESQVLGVNILTGKGLHPKSPLNWMPNDSQIEYYGSCPGMSSFKSAVRTTLISENVMDIMNSPNIFGPPVQDPSWFGWQNCLENLAVPALPYAPDLLITAVRDYKEDMLPIFRSDLWKHARPLTDHENLCGIPGRKFMDAIKLDTSIGYPLTGKKRNHVTELPATEDKPNNRVLDKVIMDEILRCENNYRQGDRAYPIAKACKKDEVLSKPKCRIFYGNAISLTWLIRKYFLPILRVMQMNPLVSECAVGVNSHGPEWDELYRHIVTYGEDRLIGGDYGKYDQKLPSQLIFAALRILIDFARECDYSQEDLDIMEAMTGDVVYALIAYNGDLVGLTEGTHISGNSLTVIINGICGSLNLRCFFYDQYPVKRFDDRMKFRDCVKLITYGDDNIGSVKKGVNKFTIKGASNFLARYGQTYTMPDKESELTDFLPIEEFEFLKRKSVYHERLGHHVGALVEKSCFKMLHCYLRSKDSPLSEELACAVNIDTALSEWFNHGEEVYEYRRSQLKEVAVRSNIRHFCEKLDSSYSDRVETWRQRYIKDDYVMYNEPDGFEN